MTQPFLQLHGIGKAFGNTVALQDVHLDVRPDELLTVLGPTGAGKTTMLRTVVGLEKPDGGTITLQQRDITGLPPAARDMALVFQNFSLYPNWTVRRNLEFPLKAPGRELTADEIDRRCRWAAGLLDITRLLDRPAVQLSGGEMQRVAIGRAIVRQPAVFLMDEPLTNLDAKLREALRVELTVLRRELGIPMVFVTHDQAEALSMGDRIAVLHRGRVLQTDTPETVYERPATPDVARQLGQPAINLLPVEREDGHWHAAGNIPVLPVGAADDHPPKMLLGIRPEHIQAEGGAHAARVEVVEDTGPEKTILADWGGSRIHLLTPRQAPWRPGDTIHPRIPPARALLWPRPATGAIPS